MEGAEERHGSMPHLPPLVEALAALGPFQGGLYGDREVHWLGLGPPRLLYATEPGSLPQACPTLVTPFPDRGWGLAGVEA